MVTFWLHIAWYLSNFKSNTCTLPSKVEAANTVLEYGAQAMSVTWESRSNIKRGLLKDFRYNLMNIQNGGLNFKYYQVLHQYLLELLIHHYLLWTIIPNLQMPLCSTCHKNRWDIGIPNNIVNWSFMCLVGMKKFRTVFSSAFVNQTFISTDQEYCVIIRLEWYTADAIWINLQLISVRKYTYILS